MSPLSARKAEELGYTDIKVFHDGLPVWKKGGNIVVTEPQHVSSMLQKDIAHILVDLRKPEAAKAGHIKGAVNIPADKLIGAEKDFPAQKDAPIILYTDESMDAGAFKAVRGWGYKNASVLAGGVKGWKASAGEVLTSQLAEKIAYVPKPLPGTIATAEFKKVVAEKPADKLILDVRDADEASAGVLPGAVNIPVGALAERLGELPKDRELIVHCTTGIRAQIAQDALAKQGFKVRYLNQVIQVASDGSFEIAE